MASLLIEDDQLPTLEDHFRFGQLIVGMLNVLVINEAMRNSGLTIDTLAAACEVSELAVERWLNSEAIPRPSKLVKLAGALGIREEVLINIGYVPGALDHDAPQFFQ
jgi:Helix-turn-helix